MYLWLLLHGHATSFSPSPSGFPTECRHGRNSPLPSLFRTAKPGGVRTALCERTHARHDAGVDHNVRLRRELSDDCCD
jgi:hypothetical protein